MLCDAKKRLLNGVLGLVLVVFLICSSIWIQRPRNIDLQEYDMSAAEHRAELKLPF